MYILTEQDKQLSINKLDHTIDHGFVNGEANVGMSTDV